ncbi:MAG: conjugal transfer protein TraF [Moritella sp.]|uniref:conjugal transfer protein TraF n=1 Tax=Moritella sp. TaxID=78556 RepID=UPI0029A79B8B|nr:conjugal transfer protein TraF [Moritella sp.]MDX2320232.1 conjugal transfer protein TraF [Moritella sp.]
MKRLLITAALTNALTPTVFASQLYFDARNDAMGGAGVASSDFVTAAFVNPALLGQGNTDYIGMILPAIPYSDNGHTRYAPTSFGIQTETSDAFLGALDNVKTTLEAYDNNSNPSTAAAYANALGEFDGQRMGINAGTSFAIALPSSALSVAFFGNSYMTSVATAKVSQNDIDLAKSQNLDDLDSKVNLAGVSVSDLGLALSMNWDANIAKVSIGISPKYQRIDTYSYDISLDDNGLRKFEDGFLDGLDMQSHFNLDAGIALDFYDIFRVAVSGRNMLKKNLEIETTAYKGINQADEKLIFTLAPLVTAGFALHHSYATLTAEMDLNDAIGFESNSESRYARGGVEVNLFNALQLRAGVRHDLNDMRDDLYTLGFGISPMELVHIDLAATVSKNGAYSVYQDGEFSDGGLNSGNSTGDDATYGIDGFVLQVSAKF